MLTLGRMVVGGTVATAAVLVIETTGDGAAASWAVPSAAAVFFLGVAVLWWADDLEDAA